MNKKILISIFATSFLIGSYKVTAGDLKYPSLEMWQQVQPAGSIALQIQKPSFWHAPISFIGNHPYLTGTVIVLLGAELMIQQQAKEITHTDPEIIKLKTALSHGRLHANTYLEYKQAFLMKYKNNKIALYGNFLKKLIESLQSKN